MENFTQLINRIVQVNASMQASAANAINQALTIRNWIIGYYIIEFEQRGSDRAVYGDNLLSNIAIKINVKGLTAPELSRCRQFYDTYPQILGTLSQKFKYLIPSDILGTLSQESDKTIATDKQTNIENLKRNKINKLQVPPEKLLTRLSYSHLIQLLKIDKPLKRTFYELECIKSMWSVRELKRQINSLYFERSGLSANPEKLAELVRQRSAPQKPTDIIKNVYAFEFLEIPVKSVIEETDLETALLDHLQEFIIELGNGFCLEARQKRILIGEKYYFIDLVFYHRILKSHIIIELKIGAFEHGDIGQLNTYINFYKQEISEKADNPPVGILLVAEKDHALIKYATAGMDENLFIQKYLVQLPDKVQLEKHIEEELKKLL